MDARGVRRVIDALSASGKAIVGHNSLLDMLHITNAFIGPVASLQFSDFCDRVNRHLPLFFDTKVGRTKRLALDLHF
jgi:hypothetical protein